jgi:hypothetical protein
MQTKSAPGISKAGSWLAGGGILANAGKVQDRSMASRRVAAQVLKGIGPQRAVAQRKWHRAQEERLRTSWGGRSLGSLLG